MKTAEKKTYWECLQDPRWQKRRLQEMERAGFKCEMCETDTDPLHVHHCYYLDKSKERPWHKDDAADPFIFRVLCEGCHSWKQAMEHDVKLEFARWLASQHEEDFEGIMYSILGWTPGRRAAK